MGGRGTGEGGIKDKSKKQRKQKETFLCLWAAGVKDCKESQ
jgi:hypothetical protein